LDKLAKELKAAVAYLRTTSAANVGADKDSEKRQRKAIADYAKVAGYAIVEEFHDAAVSGADPVHTRPGFAAMLKRIEGNGVRVILVETANRFARDIMVQETGWQFLRERGVHLMAADSPSAFIDDTPTSKMIRQAARRHLRVREGVAGRQARRCPQAQAGDRGEGRRPQEPRRGASRRRRPRQVAGAQEAQGRAIVSARHLSRA
jgi:DNA invertase Pin-like site-specific DNA recombinase